jgi:hypothetical protein
MKIYVNGDSFTNGDGLADPETFPDIYPGHHSMEEALDRVWASKRHSIIDSDVSMWTTSRDNNRKYVWSTILGELVNATVVNGAVGGSCMMGIATRTIADLNLIQSRADLPDYVFIGLTNSDRLGWYHDEDVQNINRTYNWVKSSIPSFYYRGYESKHKKLFETTWATLSDEEFLINYLKECLQIKNYVKRRIGRDPIFLNTTYAFWQYKQTAINSKNQWLRMLWFDLLEFDKINDKWFNKGKFELMTACGHVLPDVHSNYARDLAREHFNWGKSAVDKDAE